MTIFSDFEIFPLLIKSIKFPFSANSKIKYKLSYKAAQLVCFREQLVDGCGRQRERVGEVRVVDPEVVLGRCEGQASRYWFSCALMCVKKKYNSVQTAFFANTVY